MKRRVYELLDAGNEGKFSRAVDGTLMLLIIANVGVIIAITVPTVERVAGRKLELFELASYIIFGGEYVLRLWCCTEDPKYSHWFLGRLRYVFRPLMLADATAIFSFFVILLLPSGPDLGALRGLRLLSRLASLGRYSAGMQAVGAVAASRRGELTAVLTVVLVLMVLASTLMFYLEHPHQPTKFPSIPATFYWSLVTVTTLGYGDITPVTSIGRILTAVIALLGVGIFALPAGILGSGFVEQMHLRRAHGQHTCPHCGGDLSAGPFE